MALRRESSRYGAWRLKLHRPAQEFQRPKGAASYWPQRGVLEVNAWPVNVDGKTESSVLSQASGKARSPFFHVASHQSIGQGVSGLWLGAGALERAGSRAAGGATRVRSASWHGVPRQRAYARWMEMRSQYMHVALTASVGTTTLSARAR